MLIVNDRVLVVKNREIASLIENESKAGKWNGKVVFFESIDLFMRENDFSDIRCAIIDFDTPLIAQILNDLLAKLPGVATIALIGAADEQNIVEFLSKGLCDYVVKTNHCHSLVLKKISAIFENKIIAESQKQYNTQLEKIKTEIKKVENIKTELIENLCHELRTPLSSIRGYTELVLKGKMGEVTTKQNSALSVVLKNADKMLVLIDELSDFTKIQNYKNTTNIRKIDVVSVVSEAIAALASKTIEKKISVDFALSSRPFFISADFSQIAYVFTTVISNVIKAKEENSRFAITYSHTDSDITIVIENSKLLSEYPEIDIKLENFFSSKNLAGNSGLNVEFTLIAEIVKLHGGSLKIVQSNDGEQSLVFNFPLYIEKDISYLNLEKNEKGGKRKIIVVDDDSDCISLLSTILESDYNVVVTNSAFSMFKALEIHKDCSLILLDINMVDLDGISICKMLKQNPDYSAIPVLMISASMQEQKKRQSLEAGALGFLEKPFEADKISQFINNIII